MGKILRKIFPPSGYRSPLLSYPVLLALFLAELYIFVSLHFGDGIGGDCPTYVAGMESLSRGEIDPYRTPVMSAVMLALRTLAGPSRLFAALQIANCIFAVAGVWYFMRAALKFTFGRRRAAFWLTAVLCLNPWWHHWVAYTLSETMALMASSIFIYWTVRDLPRRPGVLSAVMSCVWLAVMMFLRPVMLCMLPGMVLFWLLLARRSGGAGARAGLAGTAVCALLVAGYVAAFGRTFGVCKMTAVSDWNNYWFLSEAGCMRPEYTDNPALKQFIEEVNADADTISTDPFMLRTWGAPDVCEEMPMTDIDALIRRAFHENRDKILPSLLTRLRLKVWYEPLMPTYYLPELKIVHTTVSGSTGLFLLFQAAGLLWLVRLWRRGVRPPGAWLCWYMMTALAWTSYIGAYYEWARLIIPAVPAILLFCWQVLSFTRPAPQRPLP